MEDEENIGRNQRSYTPGEGRKEVRRRILVRTLWT
jgi:hypothetical protein